MTRVNTKLNRSKSFFKLKCVQNISLTILEASLVFVQYTYFYFELNSTITSFMYRGTSQKKFVFLPTLYIFVSHVYDSLYLCLSLSLWILLSCYTKSLSFTNCISSIFKQLRKLWSFSIFQHEHTLTFWE